jgi:hypothetical protein
MSAFMALATETVSSTAPLLILLGFELTGLFSAMISWTLHGMPVLAFTL